MFEVLKLMKVSLVRWDCRRREPDATFKEKSKEASRRAIIFLRFMSIRV